MNIPKNVPFTSSPCPHHLLEEDSQNLTGIHYLPIIMMTARIKKHTVITIIVYQYHCLRERRRERVVEALSPSLSAQTILCHQCFVEINGIMSSTAAKENNEAALP